MASDFKSRVSLGLYKGKYIVHFWYAQSLEDAQLLGRLWLDAQTSTKNSKLHTAKVHFSTRCTRIPKRCMVRVKLYRRGELRTILYAAHHQDAVTIQHLWKTRSQHNDVQIKMYLPTRGWIVDSLWFETIEAEAVARMAACATNPRRGHRDNTPR